MDFQEKQSPSTALELASKEERALRAAGLERFPALIARVGQKAAFRFLAFFTVRNRITRRAYGQAVGQFFAWCEEPGIAPAQSSSDCRLHRTALRRSSDC